MLDYRYQKRPWWIFEGAVLTIILYIINEYMGMNPVDVKIRWFLILSIVILVGYALYWILDYYVMKKESIGYEGRFKRVQNRHVSWTEEEAKEYMKWYEQQLDVRTQYLSRRCMEELKINESKLDFTPESLEYVWQFLQRSVRTKKKGKFYSRETQVLIQDVSMYLTQVLLHNDSGFKLSIYKGNCESLKKLPVLGKLKNHTVYSQDGEWIYPEYIVRILTEKCLDGTAQNTDLIQAYKEVIA